MICSKKTPLRKHQLHVRRITPVDYSDQALFNNFQKYDLIGIYIIGCKIPEYCYFWFFGKISVFNDGIPGDEGLNKTYFMKIQLVLLFIIFFLNSQSQQHDWPMWRYDHHRSAYTPEQLADTLYLQWQAEFDARTPVWDDPLNQNLMPFDRIFEPVVAGNRIFLGFNDKDKVVALDLQTGKELWHFYTDGPLRLPMAVNRGKLYFTGDDGFCYCLQASDGSLVWKRMLAPSANKLLGNRRFISMWPARGGIVIKDDILYTAAGIFPLMGTFIYALNAETGEIIWKNEGTGSNYILQPHRSPAFADVAPQGPFTISGNKLLVAGGRSVPAAFDLRTGEELYYQLAASGKTGGAFTCANDLVFFNHHRERMTCMYDSENGNLLSANSGEYPVVDGNVVYFSGKAITGAKIQPGKKAETLWKANVSATNDLIRAGDDLYAADSSGITALRLVAGSPPVVKWRYPLDKNVVRLLAANGRLIAVTGDGAILVFGDSPVSKPMVFPRQKPWILKSTAKAGRIVRNTGVREGYGLLLGGDISLIEGLLATTSLNLIVYDKDSARIKSLREYFDRAGVPAERAGFLHFGRELPLLPKYFSSLTIVSDLTCTGSGNGGIPEELLSAARPYDGKIIIMAKGKEKEEALKRFSSAGFEDFMVAEGKDYCLFARTGPLKGSSTWTHNYGNIANTVKSDDELVKAPLGILWFGGSSNLDVLPRHGHGPGEQVIDGRLIIQGINSLSARDVYTGRVLWKREFKRLMDDSWLVYYNETYDEENPLDPKYNQVHMPGANARGTNFIATKEYVYLIEGNRCNLIDIKTGETARVFETGDDSTKELGYIGVYDDLLILGNNFAEYNGMENDSIRLKNPLFTDYNLTASRELLVMDRFTGKMLWRMNANHGFIHNSVIAGDGKLFCLDKLPQYLETKLRRRGDEPPVGSRLLYLDARTGNIIHQETKDVFGTWLGYSAEHQLLLQATRPSRDMLNGEEGKRMIAYDVVTKNKIWDKEIKYANPPILHNDKIYTNGEAFHLLSGDPLMEKDPVTGEELKWSFKREYGCGIVSASEHLLSFRSASAGFVNLESMEGTGSLGGWKAGCSTNLIAADGVLNSPDYTRTCQCPYQNQTSLALIHMPWMAYWTNSNYTWNGSPVQKLGLNFNAPGDRVSSDNVLWLEYPFTAGTPPGIPVKMDTTGFRKFRKEPFMISSEETPWVSASALEGIRSLEVTLTKEVTVPEAFFTIRLYFAEPENKKPGERVFDIFLQDRKVSAGFDIAGEAGQSGREVIKTYHGIPAGKTLKLDLQPLKGNTLICGIEILRETPLSTIETDK